MSGRYSIASPAQRVRNVSVFLTTKFPAEPMRAPMASASWIMEGTIDAVARELSLDPVPVRRLNSIGLADLPFITVTGETYVGVTPRETLEAAVAAMDYQGMRARHAREREKGHLVGLGLCTVIESTTYGSAFYRKAGIPGSGHEMATARIEPTGGVHVSCGLMASGQGYETTLAQSAAEGLGVAYGEKSVVFGLNDLQARRPLAK